MIARTGNDDLQFIVGLMRSPQNGIVLSDHLQYRDDPGSQQAIPQEGITLGFSPHIAPDLGVKPTRPSVDESMIGGIDRWKPYLLRTILERLLHNLKIDTPDVAIENDSAKYAQSVEHLVQGIGTGNRALVMALQQDGGESRPSSCLSNLAVRRQTREEGWRGMQMKVDRPAHIWQRFGCRVQ